MTEGSVSQQFEELWAMSLSRAEASLAWSTMSLEEKKAHSSRFRRAMERYGLETSDGARMDGGAYASPKSSKQAG